MNPLRKFLFLIGTFCILHFIFVIPAHAAVNFSTDLSITYTYNSRGEAEINEQFSVTNLTSRYLISNYEYEIPGDLPARLSGKDDRGPLDIQTQKLSNGHTLVRVIFNTVIAGKDQTMNFSLSHAGSPAIKDQDVWNIAIPKIVDPDVLNRYTVRLVTPREFGLLAYSSVDPSGINPQVDKNNYIYTFSDNPEMYRGISVLFGNLQILKFVLQYFPVNSGPDPSEVSLLLPTEMAGQQILLSSFSPPPLQVSPDAFGTWAAVYSIPAHTNGNIVITGQARLLLNTDRLKYGLPGSALSASGIMPAKTFLSPDKYILPKENLSLTLDLPLQIWPFHDNQGTLVIKNNGINAVYSPQVSVTSAGINTGFPSVDIPVILPGGYVRIPLTFSITLPQYFSDKYLQISAGKTIVTYNLPGYLFYFIYGCITFVLSLAFFGLAALTHRSWGIYLQKLYRPGHLHR